MNNISEATQEWIKCRWMLGNKVENNAKLGKKLGDNKPWTTWNNL